MKKDIDKEVEICDCCEVHENLLQIVNETIPEENELYDLAELFKVFGDSTRKNSPASPGTSVPIGCHSPGAFRRGRIISTSSAFRR